MKINLHLVDVQPIQTSDNAVHQPLVFELFSTLDNGYGKKWLALRDKSLPVKAEDILRELTCRTFKGLDESDPELNEDFVAAVGIGRHFPMMEYYADKLHKELTHEEYGFIIDAFFERGLVWSCQPGWDDLGEQLAQAHGLPSIEPPSTGLTQRQIKLYALVAKLKALDLAASCALIDSIEKAVRQWCMSQMRQSSAPRPDAS